VPDRPRLPVTVTAAALATVVLLGTSCGAAPPTTTSPTTTSPNTAGLVTSTASGVDAASRTTTGSAGAGPTVDVPADRVGRAHQAALGLIALGTLGAEKGGSDAVRALGEQVTADGRAFDERIRALATGAGIALGDDLGAVEQALVGAVGQRTGPTFDAGWRQAVLDLARGARADAVAVRDSAASEEAKAAARDVLTRMDALDAALRGTAAPPAAVPAGSGGQAASPSPVPIALIGLGALLLVVAVRLRRPAR
jgi:hypothetical protein